MTFGELLKDWMAEQRYNGAEAAAQLEVSPSTVTRWLRDKGAPDIKRVDFLADRMRLSVSDVAVAVVESAGQGDPAARTAMLLETILSRVEAIEATQLADAAWRADVQSQLDALQPGAAARSRRRDA